ncbi:hypothetical protein SSX86_003438 [Deinandra increscens subsp. villosa]|uniref:ACT domain-containing protein ACR n=1 Tax=Deinandra increscens subsp. villosa TaxID=3103831 RepID=A0AAP0H6S4_9ASTR
MECRPVMEEIPTRRRRQAGEDRRPAERTRTLLPVKLFSDAIGVKNVAAPAELAKHIVLIVIRRANKAHPIDGSMAVILQIFEPDNRQIHEADVLLVEARVNAAVSEEIRGGVSDEIEEIGFDSEDGEEEADVEDEVHDHHGELFTCFVCLKFGDSVKWEVWGKCSMTWSGSHFGTHRLCIIIFELPIQFITHFLTSLPSHFKHLTLPENQPLRRSMATACTGAAVSSFSVNIRANSPARRSRFDYSSSTTIQLSPFKSAFSPRGSSHFVRKNIIQASIDGVDSLGISSLDADIPTPIVLIDQDSDPAATIVQVSFGDRLGALIDTMKALKDLGLDVAKGTVTTEGSVTQTKFFITRLSSGRKVEDPDLLERIRLTIINNLLKYHPESSSRLAMGEAFGIHAPVKKLGVDIATHIHVKDDGPKRSLLCIETEDRPGLLLEIVKIIENVNITVESAEIDTEGLVAKDKFHVSYRGAALNSSLSQVLMNCLRYYFRKSETGEDSY